MPLISYVPKKFKAASRDIIDKSNEIIRTMQAAGFTLSLRQLYYRLVTKNYIANEEKSYKRLKDLISDARLAGEIDWDAIEDRTRYLRGNAHQRSPQDALEGMTAGYRRDKWVTQQFRPEVWVEKDALVDVAARVCRDMDIDYFANRGHVSQSEMWRAAMRFQWTIYQCGQTPVIIHLGDHDPSGIHMTKDISRRIGLFLGIGEFPVNRIALNMDQVAAFDLPPNPAKESDSRYPAYVREFGVDDCWELDALDPTVMMDLIRERVEVYRDDALYDIEVAKEQGERAALERIVAAEKMGTAGAT